MSEQKGTDALFTSQISVARSCEFDIKGAAQVLPKEPVTFTSCLRLGFVADRRGVVRAFPRSPLLGMYCRAASLLAAI